MDLLDVSEAVFLVNYFLRKINFDTNVENDSFATRLLFLAGARELHCG